MTTSIVKRPNGNSPVSFGSVVDNIFQNSLRQFMNDSFWEPGNRLSTGSAPVNVREADLQYELDVIAPGCRREDFTINVENNTLVISLNHKEERKEQNEKKGWVRNEYIQQSFARKFTMDDTVDVSNISANYRDGILHVVLPKNEKAQRMVKNIEIK